MIGWLRPVVLLPVSVSPVSAGAKSKPSSTTNSHTCAGMTYLVSVIQSVIRDAALLPSRGMVGVEAGPPRARVLLR